MMFSMSLKMTIRRGFKGSEEHSKLCNRKGKDPKAAACLACLIKNRETSVTVVEHERKNSRDKIEGWVQGFCILLRYLNVRYSVIQFLY